MEYFIEKVVEDIYVIAVWDNSWSSYNNCYLIIQESGITLIDTGKLEHKEYILKALQQIEKTENDITTIIVTHGHKDHVGGSRIFSHAVKLIHSNDLDLIEPDIVRDFKPILVDNGFINGLSYLLLRHHTEGSIALYLKKHKILFIGDFHCFFGERVKGKSIIGEWIEIRNKTIDFVKKIVTDEDAFNKYKLYEYFEGLNIIRNLDIEYLCTGHGMVLKKDIKQFIIDLISCKTV